MAAVCVCVATWAAVSLEMLLLQPAATSGLWVPGLLCFKMGFLWGRVSGAMEGRSGDQAE